MTRPRSDSSIFSGLVAFMSIIPVVLPIVTKLIIKLSSFSGRGRDEMNDMTDGMHEDAGLEE
jgi:hypothetical protein